MVLVDLVFLDAKSPENQGKNILVNAFAVKAVFVEDLQGALVLLVNYGCMPSFLFLDFLVIVSTKLHHEAPFDEVRF